MIGAKTLVTLTLLTAGLAAALAFGVLSPERLASRGWATLCLAGGFSFVVGTLMFRFWRLGEKSRHYFRWATDTTQWNTATEAHFLGTERRRITLGDNQGEAFDLGEHGLALDGVDEPHERKHVPRLAALQMADEVVGEEVAPAVALCLERLSGVLADEADAGLGERSHRFERDVLGGREQFDFVAVATGFALFTLVFSSLLHSEKYNKVKLEPYECGIVPVTDARDRYSIRYYLVAMLFVIFDVETVFMFPWAVIFNRLLLFGLIEMIVFIFILVVGYYYAWQKGALEWV